MVRQKTIVLKKQENTSKSVDTYLRPFQFAKHKGVSVQSVYRWIREGKIPKENVRKIKTIVERLEIRLD